jgi:hypothetical protein
MPVFAARRGDGVLGIAPSGGKQVRAHLGARRGANARYFRSAGLLLQQAARVELIINLQTAEAFGLIIIPRRK